MRVVTVSRKPCEGSITGNVLAHGTGALCIEACRIATTENLDGGAYSSGGRRALPGDRRTGAAAGMFEEGKGRLPGQYEQPVGRWPSNVILVGRVPVEEMDEQSGIRRTTWISPSHQNNRDGEFLGKVGHPGQQGYNDTGTAARYFKQVGR